MQNVQSLSSLLFSDFGLTCTDREDRPSLLITASLLVLFCSLTGCKKVLFFSVNYSVVYSYIVAINDPFQWCTVLQNMDG